jgi:hypothetical protein
MITVTFISTSLTSLFFLLAGISVYVSWRKQRNTLLKFFAIFLILFGVQQLFFALGTGPAALNPEVSNWLWAIAHIFMFIAISYFLRFALHLRLPSLEKPIFFLTILYSIIGIVVLFYNAPNLEPFLLENGVYNWQVPALAGAVIGIFTTVCLVFSLVVFVIDGSKVGDRVLKLRSFLIAAGILVFLVGGPMHNFVRTPLLNFLADAFIIIGAISMVIGVYSRKIFKTKNYEGPTTNNQTS